jgi:hypothetical protein
MGVSFDVGVNETLVKGFNILDGAYGEALGV